MAAMRARSPDLERVYTVDEYMELDLPDDGTRYQLIEGKIYMPPAPGDRHGRVEDNLYSELTYFNRQHKLGRLWQNTAFRFSPSNAPAPDLAFVKAARVPPVTGGAVNVIPDLCVEVVGTQPTKDLPFKLELYQLKEVPLVWVIWSLEKKVDIYYQGQKTTLGIRGTLEGRDVIPGFTMPVRALFE